MTSLQDLRTAPEHLWSARKRPKVERDMISRRPSGIKFLYGQQLVKRCHNCHGRYLVITIMDKFAIGMSKTDSIICEFRFFCVTLRPIETICNIMELSTANNMTSSELIHPGEIIKDEIMARGLTQKELAQQMGVSYTVFYEILNGKRPVTTEYACSLRLHLERMPTSG